MMVALDWFVSKTRFGRGIRAVAQDPNTAALMGVNKNRVILLVFLLGGLMAGVAAVFADMKSATPGSTSASCSASRRSPRRCSAASATCAAPLLGGLLLGLVENYAAAPVRHGLAATSSASSC